MYRMHCKVYMKSVSIYFKFEKMFFFNKEIKNTLRTLVITIQLAFLLFLS